MSIVTKSAMALALTVVALPAAANAGSREDARIAIAEARAKIETGDQAGVSQVAGDVQARARAALDDAEEQFDKHHEGRAVASARRASSLAELALATARARDADADRHVALATPQE